MAAVRSLAAAEYRRSFDALADAFHEAGQALPHTDVLAVLVRRECDIELPATWLAVRSLVGLLARKTGSTPRSLLQNELEHTPSDEFWRAWVDTDGAGRAKDLIAGGITPATGGREPHSPASFRTALADPLPGSGLPTRTDGRDPAGPGRMSPGEPGEGPSSPGSPGTSAP